METFPIDQIVELDVLKVTNAISSSSGYIGTSLHGAIVATSYNKPSVTIRPNRNNTKYVGFYEAVEIENLAFPLQKITKAFECLIAKIKSGYSPSVSTEIQTQSLSRWHIINDLIANHPGTKILHKASLTRISNQCCDFFEVKRNEIFAQKNHSLSNKITRLNDENIYLLKKLHLVQNKQLHTQSSLEISNNELEKILGSRSWKFTAPLRKAAALLKRFRSWKITAPLREAVALVKRYVRNA